MQDKTGNYDGERNDMGQGLNTGEKQRNSSIELLRIVCLFLIFWMHGASSFQENEVSAWLSIAADTIGNIGVSCFILISGYFGIRWNGKRMLKLDYMLIFYSWTGLLLEVLWNGVPGGETLLSCLFPVIGKRSWYFTCYFVLAMLAPFLNEAMEKLQKERFRQLLAVMLFAFSGVTTIFFFDLTGDGGKGIVHMVMLYLIGRYIRLHMQEKKYGTTKLIGCFLLVAGVNFALNGALYLISGTVQNRFARDNTLFTVAEAVLVFLIFCNFQFENKAVNRLAGFVPAVFMMEWTLREALIHWVYDYLSWNKSSWYHLILLAVAVILICVGSLIEALRRLIFGKAEGKLSDMEYQFLVRIGQKLIPKLCTSELKKNDS